MDKWHHRVDQVNAEHSNKKDGNNETDKVKSRPLMFWTFRQTLHLEDPKFDLWSFNTMSHAFSALTSGRASGLWKIEWWEYWGGYLSGVWCKWFAYGLADATATPSSLASVKSRMVYLSGDGLSRMSMEKRPLNECVCVCVCVCATWEVLMYTYTQKEENWAMATGNMQRNLMVWMRGLTKPPGNRVCKPAYLVPVPSQDKLGGLCQEGHPA